MIMLNTIQYNLLIPIAVYFSIAGISPLELSRSSKYQHNEAEIIAENAKPKLVSNQFKFTEGPAVDKKGNVFFTDQPNDKIMDQLKKAHINKKVIVNSQDTFFDLSLTSAFEKPDEMLNFVTSTLEKINLYD